MALSHRREHETTGCLYLMTLACHEAPDKMNIYTTPEANYPVTDVSNSVGTAGCFRLVAARFMKTISVTFHRHL